MKEEEMKVLKEELLELIHERKIIRIMGRNFFGTLEWAVFYRFFYMMYQKFHGRLIFWNHLVLLIKEKR